MKGTVMGVLIAVLRLMSHADVRDLGGVDRVDGADGERRALVSRAEARNGAGNNAEWFSADTFSADEGCEWSPADIRGLRTNACFIAGPGEGQDRDSWLASLQAYRAAVREGTRARVLDMRFDGVRAWTRIAVPLAKAFDLKPGDTLDVVVEARWVEGNDTLCVAFDVHQRGNDTKVDWSGVQAALAVGKDSEWHSVRQSVAVPTFDVQGQWLRPIFGMDATHDPTPGRIEIRSIRMSVHDAERMEAVERVLGQQPGGGLDLGIYRRKDLAWAAKAFTCHFTFMYVSVSRNLFT